jgi:RimJ/RimL family protein N-acetyltransferase
VSNTHITLKKPERDDLDFIRWLWSDPETMAPVGGPVLLDDQTACNWFHRMIDPGSLENCYRLIQDQSGNHVGEISYHRLDLDLMRAEFNIKIACQHRGNGYAHQAMIIFLDEYFNHFDGRILIDKVASSNIRGQQVLLEFGFEHDPSASEYFLVIMTKEKFNSIYQSSKIRNSEEKKKD